MDPNAYIARIRALEAAIAEHDPNHPILNVSRAPDNLIPPPEFLHHMRHMGEHATDDGCIPEICNEINEFYVKLHADIVEGFSRPGHGGRPPKASA